MEDNSAELKEDSSQFLLRCRVALTESGPGGLVCGAQSIVPDVLGLNRVCHL